MININLLHCFLSRVGVKLVDLGHDKEYQQVMKNLMRGKKFCVVMAGNPYTESGDVFSIPDMLANRADIYNLGDVLGGKEDVFALSYIENCLTSNAVLAPLALRDMKRRHVAIGYRRFNSPN